MNFFRDECKDISLNILLVFWKYYGLVRDGINLLLNNGFEEL